MSKYKNTSIRKENIKTPNTTKINTFNIPLKYLYIFLFIFPLIIYSYSLKNKYAIDDSLVIQNNKIIHKGIKGIPEIFTSHYADYIDETDGKKIVFDYRPITRTSFAIEYQIFGERPFYSYLINLLLYVLTGFLLFKLLQKILNQYNILFAFLITVLFLAHPIHSEVVCNIKNRDELFCFIFIIISTNYFLKYNENNKISYLLLGTLMFIISYLSKTSAMVFALGIPLVMYFFSKTDFKKYIITFSVLAIISVFLIYMPNILFGKPQRFYYYFENPILFEKSFLIRIGITFYSLLIYLRLLIFPHPLGFYYGYSQIPVVGITNVWVIISFLIYLGLVIYAFYKIKEKSLLSFSILYYLITISMFSNFFRPVMGIVGERLLFAPSLGFCIALPILFGKFFKVNFSKSSFMFAKSGNLIFFFSIIILLYSIKTFNRTKAWKNANVLYKTDISYLKNSFKANAMYGALLLFQTPANSQKMDELYLESEKYLRRAINIYPNVPPVWNNLGRIQQYYYQQEDSALYCYNKARSIDTTYFAAYYNLGDFYSIKKDNKSAIYFFEKSIKFNPTNEYGFSRLLYLYFKNSNIDKAFTLLKDYSKKFPESSAPYEITGNFYSTIADSNNAIKYWSASLQKNPENELLQSKVKGYKAQMKIK